MAGVGPQRHRRKIFLFNKLVSFYEKKWKNIVQPDRPHMTSRRVVIASGIPKATNTNSECVTRISFPLQQWLHERAWMLLTRILTVFFKCFGKTKMHLL